MEVTEWNKMVPSLPLLSCEVSVAVKENPDRKKKILNGKLHFLCNDFFFQKTFDPFQSSSSPFQQVTLYHSNSCVLLYPK